MLTPAASEGHRQARNDPLNSTGDGGADLRLERPLHYLFPPLWRTRLKEVDVLLRSRSELRSTILEVRSRERDWEWEEGVNEILCSWPDLFPNEAGRRVAAAIIYGGSPSIWRCDADTGWEFVDVFAEPVSRYKAALSGTGRNAFASRDRSDIAQQLLSLLAAAPGSPALSHAEASNRLRMDKKSFQRTLSRLRSQLDVPIRRAKEQDLVLRYVNAPARAFRRPASGSSAEYVRIPVSLASLCTGLGLSELARLGVQRFRTNALVDGVMLDVVQVPRAAMVRDPPEYPLEVLLFLESLAPEAGGRP